MAANAAWPLFQLRVVGADCSGFARAKEIAVTLIDRQECLSYLQPAGMLAEVAEVVFECLKSVVGIGGRGLISRVRDGYFPNTTHALARR
jgi:hypothetical protein